MVIFLFGWAMDDAFVAQFCHWFPTDRPNIKLSAKVA